MLVNTMIASTCLDEAVLCAFVLSLAQLAQSLDVCSSRAGNAPRRGKVLSLHCDALEDKALPRTILLVHLVHGADHPHVLVPQTTALRVMLCTNHVAVQHEHFPL